MTFRMIASCVEASEPGMHAFDLIMGGVALLFPRLAPGAGMIRHGSKGRKQGSHREGTGG
jgi:hypothetical protein